MKMAKLKLIYEYRMQYLNVNSLKFQSNKFMKIHMIIQFLASVICLMWCYLTQKCIICIFYSTRSTLSYKCISCNNYTKCVHYVETIKPLLMFIFISFEDRLLIFIAYFTQTISWRFLLVQSNLLILNFNLNYIF